MKDGGGGGGGGSRVCVCVSRGGRLSLATTCRCLSLAECERLPLSRPRLAPCLTPTLHLPVASLHALQQAEGRGGGLKREEGGEEKEKNTV